MTIPLLLALLSLALVPLAWLLAAERRKVEELASRVKALQDMNLRLETMKGRVESVLHYTMDPLVAQQVIAGQLRNEKRRITVLFADLEGFTARSETMPPEVSVAELNRLFSAMEPVLRTYRGHLDKYIGDGMMAEFGVPHLVSRHALMGAIAGLKMQERMREGDFPWRMRIGIANGPALVGLMGSESRKNYTALGDTVNLASRLQAFSAAGGVCVDSHTHEAVSRWFHARRIRKGLSPYEADRLEEKLSALRELVRVTGSAEHCLEAAKICLALGDPGGALDYQRKALALDPQRAYALDDALGRSVLTCEELTHVDIKGKKDRIAAFELLGLRDPLDDHLRVPRAAVRLFEELSEGLPLPAEVLLPLEALEGAMGHAKVTAALSALLARAAGFDEPEQRDALWAGYCHDIGKRNVPESLIGSDRVSTLRPQDRQILDSHAPEGVRVIRDLALPVRPCVEEAVAAHHAPWAEAPVLARIVALAEEYEDLTGWRPEHEPWEPWCALAELGRGVSEGRLDPKLGAVFLRALESEL